MKQKITRSVHKKFSGILLLMSGGLLVFYLAGCTCAQYCAVFLNDPGSVCSEYCSQSDALVASNSSQDSSNATVVTNPPIPKKEGPGEIESSVPDSSKHVVIHKPPFPNSGEYFSTVLTGGTTSSFMSVDDSYGSEFTKYPAGTGFHFGVGTAVPLGPGFGISGNIRVKQLNGVKKIDYGTGGGGGSEEFKTTYNYSFVSGNLLARVHLGRNFSIAAGPELNFLAGATRKESSGDKEKIKNESMGMGVSVLGGIRYEIPNGRRRPQWGISLMYDHNLSRLNKKEIGGFTEPAQKIGSVQLGISRFICGSCGKK